jgi:hypothetical protein
MLEIPAAIRQIKAYLLDSLVAETQADQILALIASKFSTVAVPLVVEPWVQKTWKAGSIVSWSDLIYVSLYDTDATPANESIWVPVTYSGEVQSSLLGGEQITSAGEGYRKIFGSTGTDVKCVNCFLAPDSPIPPAVSGLSLAIQTRMYPFPYIDHTTEALWLSDVPTSYKPGPYQLHPNQPEMPVASGPTVFELFYSAVFPIVLKPGELDYSTNYIIEGFSFHHIIINNGGYARTLSLDGILHFT